MLSTRLVSLSEKKEKEAIPLESKDPILSSFYQHVRTPLQILDDFISSDTVHKEMELLLMLDSNYPVKSLSFRTQFEQYIKRLENQECKLSSYPYRQPLLLGILKALGLGIERNIEAAMKHLKMAAELGSATSNYFLALIYLRPFTPIDPKIEKDLKKGMDYLVTAIQSKHPYAIIYHGSCFESKLETLEYYKKAEAEGSITAKIVMGDLYRTGDRDVAEDIPAALKYYEEAAQSSLISAKDLHDVSIGYEFLNQHQLAEKCLKEAASLGDLRALNRLGKKFLTGTLQSKDWHKGALYCRLADLTGYAPSLLKEQTYNVMNTFVSNHSDSKNNAVLINIQTQLEKYKNQNFPNSEILKHAREATLSVVTSPKPQVSLDTTCKYSGSSLVPGK